MVPEKSDIKGQSRVFHWAAVAALVAVLGACNGDSDENTIEFSGLDDCILEASFSLVQNGDAHNQIENVSDGKASVDFGDGIDWSKDVEITIRVRRVKDDDECAERIGRGHELHYFNTVPGGGEGPFSVSGDDLFYLAVPDEHDVPDACSIQVEFRDSRTNATHDGQPYSDFSTAGANAIPLTPTDDIPSEAGKLGYVSGTYIDPGPPMTLLGFAVYKQTELDIQVNAPCIITDVKRVRTTLPGHNAGPEERQLDDGPDLNRSRVAISPQHWIITDAPGFARGRKDELEGVIYHKRFNTTITVELNQQDHHYWTVYDVWVSLDGNGDLRPPPSWQGG